MWRRGRAAGRDEDGEAVAGEGGRATLQGRAATDDNKSGKGRRWRAAGGRRGVGEEQQLEHGIRGRREE